MGQEIIVTYRAEVDALTRQLDIIIAKQEEIGDAANDAQKDVINNLSAQEFAAKKRAKLLDLEEKELEKLKQLRKLAFNPKDIRDFDTRIQQAAKNIQLLGEKSEDSLGGVGASIKSIGAGIASALGVAFTVQAAVDFGKASVNAFLEADKVANKLKNTLIAVNGETEQAFERLIKQSQDLQNITIFSDDSIQQAQAALAAFGLTADQIEDLIPKMADFASVANIDIVQAAQQIGAALEGNGREFKKYGIEVTASASRFDNFNTILKGFTRFQGAASAAATTFAGKLQQQTNKIDDLQEKIGEKLLPAFLKIKEFGLRAIQVIADLFGAEQLTAAQKAADTYGKITTEFNLSIEVLKRGNLTQEQRKELIAEINTQYGEYLPNLLSEKSSLEEIEKAQAAVNKQLEGRILLVALEEDIVRITKNSAAAVKALLQVQKDRIKAESEVIDNATLAANKRDQLNKREDLANALIQKGRDELAGLNDAYAKLAAQLGINLTGNQKLLDAQKGLNEGSDIRIAGTEKEIEKIKALGAEYSALFDLLNDEQKQQLIELSITGTADLEADLKEDITKLKSLISANKLDLPVLVDATGNLLSFQDQVTILRNELLTNGITIPADVDRTSLENFKTEVAKLAAQVATEVTIPLTLEPRPPDGKPFIDATDEITKTATQIWFDKNAQIIDATQNLINELSGLFGAFSAARVTEITEETDKQLEALDLQTQAIDSNLSKRRISEKEAEKQRDDLAKQRIATEERAAKKIREIKRKQAVVDKLGASFEIILNTAKNISSTKNPALIALYAAAGAAQLAIVAATPIPYKKGSKDTGAKGHIALVGEAGPEVTFMPSHSKVLPAPQTKTYGAALDAMFDNRFDKYVMKQYVTPALVAQKQESEKRQGRTFSENVARAVMVNVAATKIPKMDAVNITNVDELAEAIVRQTRTSPYRR